MKRRIISLLLALVMVLSLLPATSVETAEAATGAFEPIWPVKQSKTIYVLSHYSGGGPHNGIDITHDGYENQTIYAVAKGTVESIYNSCNCGSPTIGCNCGDTWGNYIVVRHTVNGKTYFSRYAHLLYGSLLVKKGDSVNEGDPIAKMGSSGNSTGYHLHLELYAGSNEWDRKPQVQRSFDYYANNPSVIEGVRITTHNASDSNDYYYDWIKKNCTLKDGYYVVNKTDTLVRKTYPSYGKIKATADTNMRTLPCSAGTDASSTVIEPVSKGETFTTTALILNNQGNHWYKVESSGGKAGYLPSSKMSWEETYTSDIRIVNKAEPTNITVGNSYTVQGTVKADYSEIAMLFAYVWNGTSVNNSTPIISTQDPVNGKSYPLAGSTIDKELTFNTLAVGNYTLTISANYRNYYAKDEKTAECHTGTVRLQTSNFNIVSAHTHSWNLEVGDTTHWEQCSCGAVRNRGEHDWYQAFDDQNHWYQCFYCPAVYGGEPHNWLRDWDSNTHWQTCASCDAICGETEHSWYLTWDGNEHWYNCNYCPAHKGRAAHNISWQQISAPTCTKDGVKRATCSGCNLFAETGINKLGHSYKNGVCTRCSAKDPNYVVVDGVDRVYGSSRYDTAFQSADTLKKQMGVEKFSCAIVTSGDNFADALAGSYLAYVKNAPILLTDNDNIGDVMAYIQKNVEKGATVYALGGKAVVTDKLLDLEKKGYDVKRLAGKSRFETNLEILKECGSVAGKDVLVCTGFNFADSLSASAAKRPILLVDDKLTDGQKAYLKQQSGCKYCIVGGTGAVTGSVEKSLKSYGSVSRLAGSNRFETSVMVAKKFFSDPTTAVLAYGYNFPDGLCAGPLAATINAPLILTATGDEAQAAAYAKEEGIKDGYVLGGSALINDKAVKKIFSMGSGDKIK